MRILIFGVFTVRTQRQETNNIQQVCYIFYINPYIYAYYAEFECHIMSREQTHFSVQNFCNSSIRESSNEYGEEIIDATTIQVRVSQQYYHFSAD